MPETKTTIPAGTLLLHSPWLYFNGQFVGTLAEQDYPSLIKCSQENELKGKSPRLVDCYLSWADPETTPIFAHRPEPPRGHGHEHYHGHSATVYGSAVEKADADDSGLATVAGNAAHTHQLEIEPELVQFPNDFGDNPFTNDPRHREINAYFVDSDLDGIPQGTIVFYVGEDSQVEGWRDLGRTPIDAGFPDSDNKVWDDVYLKVVGCWPRRLEQGDPTHTHSDANHQHPDGGNAGPGATSTRIDKSSKTDAGLAIASHTHRVDRIGESSIGIVSEEPNAGRRYRVRVLIAERPGVEFQRDMLVPFLPRSYNDYGPGALPTGWTLFYVEDPEQDEDEPYPIFFGSMGPEPMPFEFYGDGFHAHTFPHSHQVELGPTPNNKYEQSEPEISCSPANHGHTLLVEADPEIESTKAQNFLPHRPVTILRF